MQVPCCLYANELSNTASWLQCGRRRGSSTWIQNSHPSQMWLGSHAIGWKSGALPSHAGQLARQWLHTLSLWNQWGLLCPSPQQRDTRLRARTGQGSGERGLWRSVCLCRAASQCAAYHNMKDVKQGASTLALLSPARGEVSAQEGTWEWHR